MKTQNLFFFSSLMLLPLVLAAAPVEAADSRGLYQALNYISCQQYMEDRKLPLHTGRNAADEIYISGWLTAYNYLTPNTYDIVPGHDPVRVMEWMDTYCKNNPDKGVEGALLQFISDRYADRMQQFTPPPEAAPEKKKKKK